MPKGLCIAALVIAVLVFALFLADLILGLSGMPHLAPFKYNSLVIDLIFIVSSLVLTIMSWVTFRQQV